MGAGASQSRSGAGSRILVQEAGAGVYLPSYSEAVYGTDRTNSVQPYPGVSFGGQTTHWRGNQETQADPPFHNNHGLEPGHINTSDEGHFTESHYSNQFRPNQGGTQRYNAVDDSIKFETLYCNNGRQYVILNQGGTRFYLDSFESGEWQRLDESLLNDGHIESDQIIVDDTGYETDRVLSGHSESTQSQTPTTSQYQNGDQFSNQKYGSIMHPVKGKLTTCHIEEKLRVQYFYDVDHGAWIRMPLFLELQCENISRMVDQIQEMMPHLQDKNDVLSVLRWCNYDVDETVSTYLSNEDFLGDEMRNSGIVTGKPTSDGILEISSLKEKLLSNENTIKQLQEEITNTQNERNKLEVTNKQQQLTLDDMNKKLAESTRALHQLYADRKVENEEQVFNKSYRNFGRQLVNLKAIMREMNESLSLLKKDVKSRVVSMSKVLRQIIDSVTSYKDVCFQQTKRFSEIKELYQKESVERRFLYNQLQELRGNIKVYCRCRMDERGQSIFRYSNDDILLVPAISGGKARTFIFDKIFQPSASQADLFNEVKPLITSTVDGYNVCILAYGQTGSGKTYTMMGSKENPGVNLRAIQELLQNCKRKESISYAIRVSMLEVYNEMLRDLLCTDTAQGTMDIHVRGRNVTVNGLSEIAVNTYEDVLEIIHRGERNRSVAETKMNTSSSRSHLVFQIRTLGTDEVTNEVIHGTLTLVDLAGSERLSRTQATGQRLVEAAAINKSLTSLGHVFIALRTNCLHVPYRNSKLTHLLQGALGGDGKACLLVNISPLEENLAETLSTIQFGSAARQIRLGKATRMVTNGTT